MGAVARRLFLGRQPAWQCRLRRTRDWKLRLFDLATGHDTLIDGGQFGSVSIAPDGRHVAYEGFDEIMKVADLSGAIMPIVPGGGCAGRAEWLTSQSLAYCASLPAGSGMLLLPNLTGGTPRFTGQTPAITSDGTHVGYVDTRGDVIVEAIDGTDHRVVLASSDPSATNHLLGVMSFTPDQSAVLVYDYSSIPKKLRIVSLTNGATVDITGVGPPSGPFGATTFYGASWFSPDGTEMLLQSSAGLVAINLATGAQRVLVAFADRISSGGAVFLDATHVLWVRLEDRSVGDLGSYSGSLHVVGQEQDDREIDAPHVENALYSSIGVSREGFIALPNERSIVTVDGTLVLRNDPSAPASANADVLGVTADGLGFIVISNDGVVRYEGTDGTVRDLVTAGGGVEGVINPYAAYAP